MQFGLVDQQSDGRTDRQFVCLTMQLFRLMMKTTVTLATTKTTTTNINCSRRSNNSVITVTVTENAKRKADQVAACKLS